MPTTTFQDQITVIEADWLNGVDSHVYDENTTAHSGSHISNTPAGNITATTVQDAINELDTEKQSINLGLTSQTIEEGVLQQVNDFATLQTINPVAGRFIYLKGHTVAGVGGGVFQALTGAAPGTYTDDGGIYAVPGDGSACWRRVLSGFISPEMYGGFTPAATQSCIDFVPVSAGYEIRLPPESATWDSGVVIPYNKRIKLRGTKGATTITMGASFGTSNKLFNYEGTSLNRSNIIDIGGMSIYGNNDPANDGIAINSAYSTNMYASDLLIVNVRNTAIKASRAWDFIADNVKVYACGHSTSDLPAVEIGDTTGAGNDNTNTVKLDKVTIERSYGIGLRARIGSHLSIVDCKLHGRALTDADYALSKEALYIEDFTHVKLGAGTEISQIRTGATSGAVKVSGTGITHLSIDGPVSFDAIGADDTYAVYFDPSNANAKLEIDAALFNGTRAATKYIYIGSSVGDNAYFIGPSNIFASKGFEVSNAKASPHTSYRLDYLRSIRVAEHDSVPANNIALDGGAAVLDFPQSGNSVHNTMWMFRAGGEWRAVGLQEWSGNIGLVTSGKSFMSRRFPLATNFTIEILRIDVTCGTGPTEDHAGGNYWSLNVTNGFTTVSIILDGSLADVTKTSLDGGSVNFGQATNLAAANWGSGSMVRANLVQTGSPATPPADVNVTIVYRLRRS
jgi:hypothetical protein